MFALPLGLIFTSIVFGIAAGACGEMGRVFIDFFQAVSDIVLILMRWFLQYVLHRNSDIIAPNFVLNFKTTFPPCRATPVGVCFMVAGAVVGLEDIGGTFQKLGIYMGTVLVALAVHMIIQMAIYAVASFRNPFKILVVGFKVFFLAFITTAPYVDLPKGALTGSRVLCPNGGFSFFRLIAIPDMLVACDKYGIQKKISRFVIPFSAALKGDGSGAFQAVACVFIAQLTGFDLTIGTYVIIA